MIKDSPRKSNYIKAKEIEEQNKLRFLSLNPHIPERSGIYILFREENGIKFAYVGSGDSIITCLTKLLDCQEIGEHGLLGENPNGFDVAFEVCPRTYVDVRKQYWESKLHCLGFKLIKNAKYT